MTVELDPGGAPVEYEEVTLVTPGLQGTVEVLYGTAGNLRTVEQSTPQLLAALEETGVDEQLTVVIHDPVEVPFAGAGATRSTSRNEDGIEVTVPGPGNGYGQMLLAVAENGAISWHLAREEETGSASRSGAGLRTYVVRREVEPVLGAPATRGIIGAVGKKVLKVLSFKLVDAALGAVGDYFVRRWEAEHRPHRLRALSAANVADAAVADLAGDDLRELASGRALLFIHGTGARTHTAFPTLPEALLTALHDRYGGRVLAFDHPTVGSTPSENLTWLAGYLREQSAALDVDVVAHSRGGLVARAAVERSGDAGMGPDLLKVGTVVFVATPNAGTALAEFDRIGDMLDRLTNLLDLVPDNPVTDPLSVIITVVKQLAVGALKGLDGLTSMTPGGDYMKMLNTSSAATATYRAVASNFEPPAGSPLATIARDAGIDFVFGSSENDLVVPTDGVHAENGGSLFPIAEPLVFDAGHGIGHSAFWDQERFASALDGWLTG